MNAFRAHSRSLHAYCFLCHRTTSGSSPWGRSRGRVVRCWGTAVETTPQAGHATAVLERYR